MLQFLSTIQGMLKSKGLMLFFSEFNIIATPVPLSLLFALTMDFVRELSFYLDKLSNLTKYCGLVTGEKV